MTLQVDNIVKLFGKTRAVDGISFSLASGRILGLVGPNGAGKTTTTNIIATLEEPTYGDVAIDGMSIFDHPDMARRVIGYMPDWLPCQRTITAHEYIDFFARAHGLAGKALAGRVEEVEVFTGVADFRDKTLAALSRGARQRVSLARSIVHDPGLLVMDEPASGLDPRARIEFRSYIKRMAREGKAVLISSHILADLADICTACLIIDSGRIVKTVEGDLKSIDLESVFMETTRAERRTSP